MADNENHPPEQDKPNKKLRLDLSEAMPHGFDEDDDEIIELKDEVSPPSQPLEADTEPPADFDEDFESDLPAVEKIIDLDALEDDDSDSENVIRLSEDLSFDEEGQDEIDFLPIEKEPVLKADDHDDVVEITEFDDILSKDTSEMVTLSEISETLNIEEDDEDEFLDLIDVEGDEEDELEEMEEDAIQFDPSGPDIEDVELKDFINDSLEEEIQISEDFEDELVSKLGVDAGEELDLAEQESAEEEFDFGMDSSEISKKIDQLDTIFFDDTEAEAELDEEAEVEELMADPDEETGEAFEGLFEDIEDEIEAEDIGVSGDESVDVPLAVGGIAAMGASQEQLEETGEAFEELFEDIEDEIEAEDIGVSGDESVDVPLAVGGIAARGASQGQLDETLEQIIERKFSGKIETLITQIIEKAVSKEIQRLKKMLLEDDSDADL